MTTILRGESLNQMKVFFNIHGTTRSYFNSNPEATQLWLEKLRDKPSPGHDNTPLEWIKDMIKVKPGDRPSALELVDRIRDCEGDFCGTCCTDDDDESIDSSYQGSVADEETTLVIGDTRNDYDYTIRNEVTESKDVVAKPSKRQAVEQVEDKQQQLPTSWSSNLSSALREISSEAVLSSADQLLLMHGFDIKSQGFDKANALYWAAANGHEGVVRLLLEKGADVNAKGKAKESEHGDDYYKGTALHIAANRGDEAMVRLLLEKGADVDAKGKAGFGDASAKGTALHTAACGGHEAVVRLLIDKGADPGAKWWKKEKDEKDYTELAMLPLAREGGKAVVRMLNGYTRES
ncbi:hypothetical protein GP486_003043 [Trichoglossum hirsutum]|uniref:Ankyrin repeat protein n=1 Tax=Trichoglossum hirsutum TaxID=265104 RepID=A0A9P8LDP1_9PEZI|nr:hypothetical protein GP486_003043 [Trichoglossum hirsutum]